MNDGDLIAFDTELNSLINKYKSSYKEVIDMNDADFVEFDAELRLLMNKYIPVPESDYEEVIDDTGKVKDELVDFIDGLRTRLGEE